MKQALFSKCKILFNLISYDGRHEYGRLLLAMRRLIARGDIIGLNCTVIKLDYEKDQKRKVKIIMFWNGVAWL